MTPRKLTGDGVDGAQDLDGVHGGLRSEAKCQAQSSFGKLERRCLAALPTGRAMSAGLAGRLRWECAAIADRDLLLPKLAESY